MAVNWNVDLRWRFEKKKKNMFLSNIFVKTFFFEKTMNWNFYFKFYLLSKEFANSFIKTNRMRWHVSCGLNKVIIKFAHSFWWCSYWSLNNSLKLCFNVKTYFGFSCRFVITNGQKMSSCEHASGLCIVTWSADG